MAYGKKMVRRRTSKARRYSRKKYTSKKTRSRIPRSLNTNYMAVMFRTRDTIVTNSNVAEQYATYRFQLSSCINNTAYQSMWEQFRIVKIQMTWKPTRAQAIIGQVTDVTPGSTTNIPSYVVAKDFDDVSTEAYVDTKSRYGSRERLVTTPGTLTFTPACLTEVYLGVGLTSYSPQFNKWIDTRYSTTPHYGARLAMESAEPGGQYALECKTKVWIQFKNRIL